MKKLIIILVAAALAGGGWYFYKKKNVNSGPRYLTVEPELRDLSEVVDTTGRWNPRTGLRYSLLPPAG